MTLAVIGLGKIGLPLAVHYASRGNDVIGVDLSVATVDAINAGREPFPGEADLDRMLKEVRAAHTLRATTDYADAVPHADTILVLVPLVVDAHSRPDFSMLDSATASIAAHLRPGTLIVYETTMPVGVTRDRWKPMLERLSGLQEGRDFHVAFSPERVLTGRVFADLRKYPKVVGALDHEGARRVVDFYEKNIEFEDRADLVRPNGVWDLGTPEAAELTKLAETTYRDVNIALANQFATFADRSGIDVYAVIDAANSQPYSHIHRPGVSVGGHCIPVYPHLYLWGDREAHLVADARELNASMPEHTVRLLIDAFGDLAGATVAVLGVTYRPGVRETAFSGAFRLVQLLAEAGASPVVRDPMYDADDLKSLGFLPAEDGARVDAAVLHTDHLVYRTMDVERELPGCRVFVDGRATFDGRVAADTTVRTLGRP